MTNPASGSGRSRTSPWDGSAAPPNSGSAALPPRWSLLRPLGEGGQAEVWLAEDLELAEKVAIKVFRADLPAAARERLRREVRLGRTLHHPGLVRVHELIEFSNRLAIVMEWIPGGSLADRITRGPLPISTILDLVGQALEALAHLHSNRVVHRDVKPSNLLLTTAGGVKLADLGLARSLVAASDVTRTNTAVGTPAYMSPEQLMGREPQPATDLYSLGATIFELLTGRRPFDTPPEGPDPRLSARPESPRRLRPDCPRWLARFTARLLEREPRDRFPDAERALAAFERRRPALSRRIRRRIAAGVASAATVMLVAFGLWHAGGDDLAGVAVSGSEVVALDRRGRELWRRGFPGFTPVSLVADLLGGRTPEVVVALHTPDPGSPEGTSDLLVLTADGSPAASTESTLSEFRSAFPDLAPASLGPHVDALDLRGDGTLQLVWTAPHARWYPTVIGGWDLRRGTPPQLLLLNSGSVHNLVSADLDRDRRPELLVVAVNNPLGFQNVLAILRGVSQLDPRSPPRQTSPDLLSGWTTSGLTGGSYRPSYTPLGPFAGPARVTRATPQGIWLAVGDATIRLDADGNPAGSRLHGRGQRPRVEFWDDLAASCRLLETEPVDWAEITAGMETRHPEAIDELPMRVAAALLVGRSLARAGRHEDAVAALEAARLHAPDDLDIALRLGERLAVAGRAAEAERALARACRTGSKGRGPLDAVIARTILAAWHGHDVEPPVRFWETQMANSQADPLARHLRGLAAFARGDWSSPSLIPRVEPALFPAIAVLQAWAALERGADPTTVRLRVEQIAANPELRDLAAVLLAEVDRRAGRTADAAASALAALAELERRGRESWESFAWIALADRVLADALEDAGRPDEAAHHRSRARRIAPGTWFGRTVTDR